MDEKTILPKTNREQIEDNQGHEVERTLIDLYRAYEPMLDMHLWPLETERWYELVFCLLATVSAEESSPKETRELVSALRSWGLLDLEVLSTLNETMEQTDQRSPIWITLDTLFQRSGLSREVSQRALTTLGEMARSLKENYHGKAQLWLRNFGLKMLDALVEDFPFSQIEKQTARLGFAIWIQNVLNMPVPVSDSMTEKACRSLETSYDQFVQAADRRSINVAILDDILRYYWEEMLARKDFQVSVGELDQPAEESPTLNPAPQENP